MSARAKPSAASLLYDAANLIEAKGCWVPKGTLNDGGHPYDVCHEKAHAWSGICAIYHVHDKISFGGSAPLIAFADEAVGGHFGGWEQRPERTQQEVVAALRRAGSIARSLINASTADLLADLA